jgi:hypothetical protein
MIWSLLVFLAQVKVGGVEFLPKNVIFPSSDERSRATAEGSLSGGCRWQLQTETRIGQTTDTRDCLVYFYRTTVSLAKRCGGTESPEVPAVPLGASERTVLAGRSCPNAIFTPQLEAKILSVGLNSDGKRQEIVQQPDGTRIVVLTEPNAVTIAIAYPDATVDTLAAK